jgi:hypothetical protein
MATMEFNLMDVLIGSSLAIGLVFLFDAIRRWIRAA